MAEAQLRNELIEKCIAYAAALEPQFPRRIQGVPRRDMLELKRYARTPLLDACNGYFSRMGCSSGEIQLASDRVSLRGRSTRPEARGTAPPRSGSGHLSTEATGHLHLRPRPVLAGAEVGTHRLCGCLALGAGEPSMCLATVRHAREAPEGTAMRAPRTPATRAATASLSVLRERKQRLAKMCKTHPETEAMNRYDNEHVSLEVSGKRFDFYLYQHFGDDGRSGAVLKAPMGAQAMLVVLDPDRFWVPAFVGRHGWIGRRLDLDLDLDLDLEGPDWDELAGFIRGAWMRTAPKELRRQVDESSG
jgi:hypothetical protein